MSRYFFDINDGSDHRDEIGREIESPAALRREALRVVTSLAAEEGEDSDGYTLVLSVRNAAGVNVLSLRMVCQLDEPNVRHLQTAS